MSFLTEEYDQLSPYRATEKALRDYKYIKVNPDLSDTASRIKTALDSIKDDYYYQVIVDYYLEGKTREEIAWNYNTSVTTISRNKNRLVNCIRICLFSSTM